MNIDEAYKRLAELRDSAQEPSADVSPALADEARAERL